ncbi:MAG: conjugal transfer protein TraF [Endomicrobium sp.]|jgi:hypothetical protein|nr:conjugal transfer protein TraF [Endomicrobium sp.]
MNNKIAILTALMLVSSLVVFASAKENRAMINGLRPMSMGGAFSAIADDENAFFYNPAGVTYQHNCLIQVFSVDIAVNTKTFDFYNFYIDNKKGLSDFESLQYDEKSKLIDKILNQALSYTPNIFVSSPNILFIASPIAINQNSLNFGFGVFSYSDLNCNFNRSIFIPSISYKAQVTGIGILPVAFKISSLQALQLPGTLSLGANFKYMYRVKTSTDNMSIDEFKNYDFKANAFYGTSFGIDFGAIYHLNSRWKFGLNVSDIYNSKIDYKKLNLGSNKASTSTTNNGYSSKINPELNLGAAYYPEKFYYWFGKYWTTNNKIVFASDLTDLINSDEPFIETPFKKFHIGTEYKYDPFVLRIGINSGYPTIGGGLSAGWINFEYAFYGEERGMYAGQDPIWFHRILLSFQIGKHNKKNKKQKVVKEEKVKN